MRSIVLSLEVQNSFLHPRQADKLAAEIRDMSARIEDTTEFEEQDVFLAQAFDVGGTEGVDTESSTDEYAKWVASLSRGFPDLVFSLDFNEPDIEGGELLGRWYFRNGRRQTAEPYMVVPDFDPDDVGEEIL